MFSCLMWSDPLDPDYMPTPAMTTLPSADLNRAIAELCGAAEGGA